MKKTLRIMGAGLLLAGIAMGVTLATGSGTIVSNSADLTQVTGAGCISYQSTSCAFSKECDAASANIACGLGSKGTNDGRVDCSSKEGYFCGGCWTYTKCSS